MSSLGKADIDPADGLPVTEVGEWAKRKHEIIANYIGITSAVRRKFRCNSAFVDLYCGPGRARLKDSAAFIDGSSVVAWKASQAGRVSGTAFRQIFVADKEPAYVDACVQRLGTAPVQHFAGEAASCAADILRGLDPNAFTVVLIDPYNLEGLRYDIVDRFAKLKHVDLIVHFSTMDIERNITRYFEVADSPLDLVAPGWRAKINPMMSSEAKLRAVFDHWKDVIGRKGFKVESDPQAILNSKNRWIYWLALASRHPLAANFWTKIGKLGPQGGLF